MSFRKKLLTGLSLGLIAASSFSLENKINRIEYSDWIEEKATVVERRQRNAKIDTQKVDKKDSINIFDALKWTIPAKYSVIFKCQHGKFVVNGRSLYKKLEEGQVVDARYKEAHRVTYVDKDDDGILEEIDRYLLFIVKHEY